jgi:pimeloyl-ACP methyl ester carboxylesterase
MRETRDLIVFDQRGIGFSSPLPNPDLAIFKILAGNFSIKEESQLMSDTLSRYKQKCIDNKIALECYITSQSAADVNVLMENLGYHKYVLYGESYGTRLARAVMDKFPRRISCVIADAPAILEDDFLSLRIKNYNDGLEKIFSYCENDPDCKEKNPNIRKDYTNGVAALAKAPIELNIGGKPFFVNPQDALFMLRYQLYAPNSKASVPAFIKALKERDTNNLNASQQFLQGFVNSLNLSLFISTGRNEEYDAKKTDTYFDSLYSTLPNLPAKLGFFTSLYKASSNWHTKVLTTEEKKPKQSIIPTLIFVNKFDPVTPPKNGFIFKETLSNAKLFVLDLQGHGVTGDCATQVMIDFMSNPKGKIDTSCLPLAN